MLLAFRERAWIHLLISHVLPWRATFRNIEHREASEVQNGFPEQREGRTWAECRSGGTNRIFNRICPKVIT